MQCTRIRRIYEIGYEEQINEEIDLPILPSVLKSVENGCTKFQNGVAALACLQWNCWLRVDAPQGPTDLFAARECEMPDAYLSSPPRRSARASRPAPRINPHAARPQT